MIYHLQTTIATMKRILQQLSHDRRTIALIFLVPVILLSLLRWLYTDNLMIFDSIAPALLGIFPFTIMFIITSITTLRERTSGTMERLMVSPIGKLDLVLGYMFAFGLLAAVQAVLASILLLYGLGLDIDGSNWFLVAAALMSALLGTALGIFVSAFAKTEFQAVQFMPALILPQILICGLLMPLDQMPELLEKIAYILPLTYVIDLLNQIVSNTNVTVEAWHDLAVILAFIIGAILLAALTLRRSTK